MSSNTTPPPSKKKKTTTTTQQSYPEPLLHARLDGTCVTENAWSESSSSSLREALVSVPKNSNAGSNNRNTDTTSYNTDNFGIAISSSSISDLHHHHHHHDINNTINDDPLLVATHDVNQSRLDSHDNNNDNNDDDDDNMDSKPTAVAEISSSTISVKSWNNPTHNQPPKRPPPPPPPPIRKKVVRFQQPPCTSSSSSSSSSCSIPNNNDNSSSSSPFLIRPRNATISTNRRRQPQPQPQPQPRRLRRVGTLSSTPFSSASTVTPTIPTNTSRLLSRDDRRVAHTYSTNTTTATLPQQQQQQQQHWSRSSSNGGGGGVWNVQHMNRRRLCHTSSNNSTHEIRNDDGDDDETDDSSDAVASSSSSRTRGTNRWWCDAMHHRWMEFWNTWFYTLAYQRTIVLMGILFVSYTGIVLFYAVLYYTISQVGQSLTARQYNSYNNWIPATTTTSTVVDSFHFPFSYFIRSSTTPTTSRTNTEHSMLLYLFCDMDIHTPMEALYFSLSTMASIGYGVSDYYFGNCCVPLLVVLLQICTAICYDAIAIGLLFQRLRRSHKRSKTILFTNTAVVQRVNNKLFLMIRVAELRHYPLMNATVRVYCIYHDRYPKGTTGTTISSNGTNHNANSEVTATDSTPNTTTAANHLPHDNIHTTYYVTKPMIVQQQHHDVLMNLPQIIVHPIAMNESPLCPPPIWYDVNGQQRTHCTDGSSSQQQQHSPTTADSTTPSISHRRNSTNWMEEDVEQLQLFMQDRNMEIIIVINGTDELTGTCTQTKQSYTFPEIQWNTQFVPCMYPAPPTGTMTRGGADGCVVDFSSFHSVEPAPLNSDYSPYIQ